MKDVHENNFNNLTIKHWLWLGPLLPLHILKSVC